MATGTTCAGRRSLLATTQPIRHAHLVMRVFNLGSSHGGVAVSNAGGRGFDTFRACAISHAGHPVPDTCTLTTAQTSSSESPPRDSMTGASRLTGGAPGSYPGTHWVRDPGRALRSAVRRACPAAVAQQESAGPSRRRSRVRIPSVARRQGNAHASNQCRRGRMDEAPVYEAGSCRFDPCRRHQISP